MGWKYSVTSKIEAFKFLLKSTKPFTSKYSLLKVPNVNVLIMQNGTFQNTVYSITGLELLMHLCVHCSNVEASKSDFNTFHSLFAR